MNKTILFTVLCLLVLAACTAPADDATRADIEDVPNSAEDTLPVDPTADDMSGSEPEIAREEIPVDKATSTFEFEGYGPGKSHIGTFDEWEGVLFVQDGKIVGGRGEIDASSVNTGIGGLDDHLKEDDFFNVVEYPEITFESSTLENGELTGELTFLGVDKQITFPVEITEDSISADFVINARNFGMKNPNVNDEVRIAFMLAR